MGGWIHAGVDRCDSAGGIDEEGVARGEFHDAKIGERSVGGSDFASGVGEKFEIQSLLGAEILVGIDGVEADSEDYGIVLDVFGLVHLKLVGFAGSTGSLIFGIEVEDDPFATVILQADGGSVLGGQGEFGSHCPRGGRGGSGDQAEDQGGRSGYDECGDQDSEHDVWVRTFYRGAN